VCKLNARSVALSQLHQVFELSSLADEEELSGGTIQPGLIKLANRRAQFEQLAPQRCNFPGERIVNHGGRSSPKRPRSANSTRHSPRKLSAHLHQPSCRSERINRFRQLCRRLLAARSPYFENACHRKAQCRLAEYLGGQLCVSKLGLKIPRSCGQRACQVLIPEPGRKHGRRSLHVGEKDLS
jgi:hypothetical protein